MIILFKYASRSRPEKFFKGLDSIYNNLSDKENFHVLCSFDTDDISMYNQDVIDSLSSYHNLTYYFGHSKTKIEAINADLDKAPIFDILVNFSDDQVFTVYGFDDIIRKDMKENFPDTDGVLHYHDDNNGSRLMTMSIMGKKYFDRFGYIYHPDYSSVYCDNEAMEVAQKLNKYKFIDTIIYNHLHWRYGLSEFDNLYKINDTAPVYQKDRIVYNKRFSKNFDLQL